MGSNDAFPGASLLVRSTLSERLVDEIVETLGAEGSALSPEETEQLRAEVTGKPDLTALKRLVRSFRRRLSASLGESLDEELAEITEDFTWAKSKRGNYVLEINRWVESIRPDLDAEPAYSGILVGGHAEQEVVYVVGKIGTEADLQMLVEFLAERQPPRKIRTKVTVLEAG